MLEIPEQIGAAMAADVDIRTKVDEETNLALEVHARAFDKDKAEIVRTVLANWAAEQRHVFTIWSRLTRGQGGGAS